MTTRRDDLISIEGLPAPILPIAALLAALLWWWSFRFSPRRGWLGIAAQFGAGCITIWTAAQALATFVHLATPLPLWLLAAGGSAAVVATNAFYQHDRSVIPHRDGRRLVAFRLTALGALLLVLAEPQRLVELERDKPREVIVLLDGSASMDLVDHRATPSEKLEIATLLGIDGADRGQSLSAVVRGLSTLDRRLAKESAALRAPAGSSAGAHSLVAAESQRLVDFFEAAASEAEELAGVVERSREAGLGLSQSTSALLSDYDSRIREEIAAEFRRAAAAVRGGDFKTARTLGHGIAQQLRFVLRRLPSAAAEVDRRFYDSLAKTQQRSVDNAAGRPRVELAREVLRAEDREGNSLASELQNRYRLRFLRYAEATVPFEGDDWLKGAEPPSGGSNGSDLAGALAGIADGSNPADIAGVIVLGDGRHFGERSAEVGARRLGIAGVPVCSIALGTESPPRDVAVVGARAPEILHVEDKATIWADVRADGLEDEEIEVALKFEGELVETKTIVASGGPGTTAVRFTHLPGAIGVFDYEIEAVVPGGDSVPANDRQSLRLATTDDRVDVLLVDNKPRWEFRYLRNLFHARDPSVHLQHVLLSPDQIAGLDPTPAVAASADRKFGDAEATALPASAEEWGKFDAIIVGDVTAGQFDDQAWEAIADAVSRNGALLVLIAGRDAMPEGHQGAKFLELLPVEAGGSSVSTPFRLRLTRAGESHPIMRLSDDPQLDRLVWDGLPALHWRHGGARPKAGAEVLAYAQASRGVLADQLFSDRAGQGPADAPLVVAQRYGLGRVLLLNFDATWRLRYATGDLYHHRFWGGALRWGGGRLLRAGGEGLRFGTDRLGYKPGARVEVDAEMDAAGPGGRLPERLAMEVFEGDRKISTELLEGDSGQKGRYSGRFSAPEKPATYRLVVRRPGADDVETEIDVRPAEQGQELADLTLDRAALQKLADLSGGTVADPGSPRSVLPYLRPAGRKLIERQVTTLWDRWWVFGILIGCLTAEWFYRRKAGLS